MRAHKAPLLGNGRFKLFESIWASDIRMWDACEGKTRGIFSGCLTRGEYLACRSECLTGGGYIQRVARDDYDGAVTRTVVACYMHAC